MWRSLMTFSVADFPKVGGWFSQSLWQVFLKSVADFSQSRWLIFPKSDFPTQWLISLKSVTDFPKIGSGFPTEPEGTGGSLPYLCGLCERWKIWGRRFEDGKNSDGWNLGQIQQLVLARQRRILQRRIAALKDQKDSRHHPGNVHVR